MDFPVASELQTDPRFEPRYHQSILIITNLTNSASPSPTIHTTRIPQDPPESNPKQPNHPVNPQFRYLTPHSC